MSRASLFCSLVILIIMCIPVSAAESYVTGTYEPVPGGYILQFIVHNTLPNQIHSFSINTHDALNPASPDGWYAYQTFREVNWSTNTEAIQPGQSLGGFSYTSVNTPGTLNWWISSSISGYVGTVTPTPVPEPSSLLALGSGLLAVGLQWIRRRVPTTV